MPIPLPVLPEDNIEICLVIPNSPEWRRIYMGALQILAQWWYWDVENASESQDVIQRVMQCAYLTGIDYGACMELDCNDIIACLNNPESGVLDAILSAINSANFDNYRNNSQNQSALILGDGNNPTCDLDSHWGGIRQVIEQADTNNTDVLQIFEVDTNIGEFLAEVFLGVFGVEAPIVQSLVDWAIWLQDNILENYEAQITTAYLDELKCDLFCLTKDDCILTPEILTNYFYNRLVSVLNFQSAVGDTITFLTAGTWLGTEIADAMFLSQFAFRAQIGVWLGDTKFNKINLDFALGANTPDNDWEILCPECAVITTYYLECDFTLSDGGLIPDLVQALWVSGVGWTEVDAGSVSRVYTIFNLDANYRLLNTKFTFTKTPATPTGFREIRWFDGTTTKAVNTVTNGTAFPTPTVFELIADQTPVNKMWLRINSSSGASDIVMSNAKITVETDLGIAFFTSNGWTEYIP